MNKITSKMIFFEKYNLKKIHYNNNLLSYYYFIIYYNRIIIEYEFFQ